MRVEIWSDVVCPWCYIGKRKFEAALASFDGRDDVEVIWRPFQLDPTAPVGTTMPVSEAYARKFGGPDKAAEIIGRVTAVAADAGIEFHMDAAQRANTLDAHALLALARSDHGAAVQNALKEKLLDAYFTAGRNIADRDTLVDLAVSVGIDGETVRRHLDDASALAATRAEIAHAGEIDVHSVPTFVFDGRWVVPGAQEVEVFSRVLARVAELERAEVEQSTTAPSCTDDSCDV
jgi:predicted DsbA family dithiol-disulfide isomerase